VNEISFPSLRKLINLANQTSYTSDNISLEELSKIDKFVEENGDSIEYYSEFYKIAINCTIYLKPKCYEVTEENAVSGIQRIRKFAA
jgi:hypothetical protein